MTFRIILPSEFYVILGIQLKLSYLTKQTYCKQESGSKNSSTQAPVVRTNKGKETVKKTFSLSHRNHTKPWPSQGLSSSSPP
jgi:hypothetical protein